MRLVAGCAALALSSLAPLAPALAQRPTYRQSMLQGGARIRIVRLASERVVGVLTWAHGDTIHVDTTDTRPERRMFFPATILVEEFRSVAVPMAAVAQIEVSTGRDRVGGAMRAARRAAGPAMIIGGLYGVSRPGNFRMTPVARGIAVGAAIGVTLGAPYGFTRGAESWRPLTIAPSGHVAAAGGK